MALDIKFNLEELPQVSWESRMYRRLRLGDVTVTFNNVSETFSRLEWEAINTRLGRLLGQPRQSDWVTIIPSRGEVRQTMFDKVKKAIADAEAAQNDYASKAAANDTAASALSNAQATADAAKADLGSSQTAFKSALTALDTEVQALVGTL